MASKMIAIKEELYEKLVKLKHGNKSFSDVIEELLKNAQKNPLAHFGIGKSMESKDLDDFEQYLKKMRQNNRKTQKIIQI
ncbi:MAG: antitoxin VapB family protein [Promethearchaeota archaeon]